VLAVDSSFGALDAFAFVVFAVLIFVGVIIVVNLGKLPGQLAHKWNHPQAGAINAMSWIGIATGGLLWPVAFNPRLQAKDNRAAQLKPMLLQRP
jgi:hypothetical protein